MDDMLDRYGKHGLAIWSNGLPDATETIKFGSREILETTLSKMSTKSKAFKFVDVDVEDKNADEMQKRMSGDYAQAPYYIKGRITQVDQDVLSKSDKIGIAFKFLSVGKAKDLSFSIVGLDLGMYLSKERVAIDGVRVSNQAVVVKKSKSLDVGGLVKFASLLYEVHDDLDQGTHATMRALMEVSLIETLGKFTKIPYWKCLNLPEDDPSIRSAVSEYFYGLTPPQQIMAVQSALISAKIFQGSLDGVMTPELGEAIARYRIRYHLSEGANVDFELFFKLLTDRENLVVSSDVKAALGAAGRRMPQLPSSISDHGIEFDMRLPVAFNVGSPLVMSVRPNRDAYLYCYLYAGSSGNTYKIYPGDNVAPQIKSPANIWLDIPSDGSKMTIRFKNVESDRVACVARDEPYLEEPPSVTVQAFTPISSVDGNGLSSLDVVVNEHQKRDPDGLHSYIAVRTIPVHPKGS